MPDVLTADEEAMIRRDLRPVGDPDRVHQFGGWADLVERLEVIGVQLMEVMEKDPIWVK